MALKIQVLTWDRHKHVTRLKLWVVLYAQIYFPVLTNLDDQSKPIFILMVIQSETCRFLLLLFIHIIDEDTKIKRGYGPNLQF
jgi:hypothetical protein